MTVRKVALPDLGKYEARLQARMPMVIAQAMVDSARPAREVLERVTQPVRDLGWYQKGWEAIPAPDTLTVFNRYRHAIYVVKGRAAGAAMPPLGPILAWVMRHLDSGPRAREIAFSVMRKIAKRGIKARPSLNSKPVYQEIADIITRAIGYRWQEVLSG